MGGVLGQLAKGHARIVLLELLAHGILVEKVSGHVTLGSVGIPNVLPTLPARAGLSDDGIALGIVARRGDVLG